MLYSGIQCPQFLSQVYSMKKNIVCSKYFSWLSLTFWLVEFFIPIHAGILALQKTPFRNDERRTFFSSLETHTFKFCSLLMNRILLSIFHSYYQRLFILLATDMSFNMWTCKMQVLTSVTDKHENHYSDYI